MKFGFLLLITLMLSSCVVFKSSYLITEDLGILNKAEIYYMPFNVYLPYNIECSDIKWIVNQYSNQKGYGFIVITDPNLLVSIDSLMRRNNKNIRSNFLVDTRLSVFLEYSCCEKVLCFGQTNVMSFQGKSFKKNSDIFTYFKNILY